MGLKIKLGDYPKTNRFVARNWVQGSTTSDPTSKPRPPIFGVGSKSADGKRRPHAT